MEKKTTKILLTVFVTVVCIGLVIILVFIGFGDSIFQQSKYKGWDWGTTLNPSDSRTTTPGEINLFAEDGCYTWWTNALALRYVGEKDQTYLSYVNENGGMSLSSYNHDTGEYKYFTLAEYEKDDHNSAALTVLPNGKILAVYARHSADKLIRWRISEEPEDITSFKLEKTIESAGSVTYIQIHRISYSEYRIFYRYSLSRWSTRTYNWETNEWSNEIVWLKEPNKGQYYLWTQEDKELGRINVFMTCHPTNGTDQAIRYGYFDGDGNICRMDGTIIGSLNEQQKDGNILTPRSFEEVYVPENGKSTRLYDVSFMQDTVGVMFGVFEDGFESNYMYSYYDKNKEAWVSNVITQSGKAAVTGNSYFGGVSFDKKDMQTIYVSRRVDGCFRLEKWTTTDYGYTWDSLLIDEATDKETVLMRPIIPYNNHDDIDVIYIKGLYPAYTKYDSQVVFWAD